MAVVKTSQAWFSFKGITSTSMNVYMLEMPTRPVPDQRGETKDVPGRDGKLFLPENTFERITIKVKVESGNAADFDKINSWLSGSGDLVFGDEPNRCYHARCMKSVERTHSKNRRLNRTWTQTWDCEPFRYEANPAAPITLSGSVGHLSNPGTIESLPLLEVQATGDVVIMIEGNEMLMVSGVRGSLFIDCDAKVAYTQQNNVKTLATSHVTGLFPVIPPGESSVVMQGVSRLYVTPRWRWL